MEIGLNHVRAAIALEPFDDDAARERMAARPRPRTPSRPWRDGAVLVLLFPGVEGLTLVLTRRTDTVEYHRGQIAFPGGAREDGESLVATALREAEEEVGIPAAEVRVLGEMTPLRIPPSGFVVTPFVGMLPARPAYRIDPGEVASVIEVPLARLIDEGTRAETEREWRGRPVVMPFYDLPGVAEPPLWGATAMMLEALLARLRAVLGGSGSGTEPPGRPHSTT